MDFVFHISKAENGYTATMDFPDQGIHASKAEQIKRNGKPWLINQPIAKS